MVGLKRLFARCIVLITLKPQNLKTLIKRLFARWLAFRKVVVLCTLCSVLLNSA